MRAPMSFPPTPPNRILTKPDIIELRNIHAKVQMQDKSTMEISAAIGVYDSKGETLKLDQNIVLSSTTGYRGQLSEAMVDIHKGNVVSEQPVEVKMLQGTLNANRLEIVNSGDLVRFDGGVNMTVDAQWRRADRKPRPGSNDRAASSLPIAAALLAVMWPRPARRSTRSRRKGRRTRCRAFRRIAISRCISRRRRWKCATRTRWRPSAATCA